MTTVLDKNVHNLAVKGTFDDCQDIVKALFGDADANKSLNLGAVNSINWARILAQIVYYFNSYFQLTKTTSLKVGEPVRFVVPTGNFGNILAGYFAKRMGLPIEKLVGKLPLNNHFPFLTNLVATNENDILDRFWKTGIYKKSEAEGNSVEGVRSTHSPAMDILVSSNFERLMFILAKDDALASGADDAASKKKAGASVLEWYQSLKSSGSFGPVESRMLEEGRKTFESERVSDAQTVATIKSWYSKVGYVLDPHTAVGIAAAEKSMLESKSLHISLSTAHPAKFSEVVKMALEDDKTFNFEEKVLPDEFKDLLTQERRVSKVENSWQEIREIIKAQVEKGLATA
jgi:threonine synthase